jgi:hAT family C-terminal dimerisation region
MTLELGVIAENQTRWNSTYLMLERALKLRTQLSLFITEALDSSSPLNPSDSISKDDWMVLQAVHDLLRPFWKLTLRLQGQATDGKYGAIWEVLPAMEFLINHLEAAKTVHSTSQKAKHLHVCISNALTKLQEYYQLLNNSLVYATSLVLNPAIKERHFDRNWEGSHLEASIPKTKEDIRTFWTIEYKGTVVMEVDPVPEISKGPVDEFEDFIYDLSSSPVTFDEYESYCNEKPLPKAPPHLIQYWNRQAVNTPSLAQMALDLLAIPAMSAECERVFSSTKILISDHRNRLKDDIIEANECVRYWIKKDYLD